MDKNSATGLILILLLTMGYFMFFAPKPPEQKKTSVEQTTTSPDTANTEQSMSAVSKIDPAAQDSQRLQALADQYSDFYTLVEGEELITTVTTDLLTLKISNKGGRIIEAYLNDYVTFDSLPLPVIQNAQDQFYVEFPFRSRSIRTDELYFTAPSQDIKLSGADSTDLVFTADIGGGRSLKQIYRFKGDTYDLGYSFQMNGIRSEMGNQKFYDLHWTSYLPKTELSLDNMRQKTTIAYSLSGDVEKMDVSDEPDPVKEQTPVDWVSYKSQFFSSILVAEEPFRSTNLQILVPDETSGINKIMKGKFVQDLDRSDNIQRDYRFYFGPNEYATLNSYDLNFQKEMDLGWSLISYINIGTTYIFKFLEKYISNYGLIVIILAFLIRMLVLPFTYRSYISMGKMRVLNATPEMKALDEKYKDDAQKLQMEKMAIYREMGVSMLGGCLPMVFSYPFLIALFFFFPQSVELRQESFLWANDLSTYDSIINLPFRIPGYGQHVSLFCLLMAISTFVFTFYQQKSQPSAANNQMKYIAYIMPIFLLFFLNSYASGLSLYYLTSNIISISQTLLIRRFVDDDKLLAQLRENQKANKKKKGKKKPKGRIQKWMEEQQKKQQQMQRQANSNRKGGKKR
ncbi:MAG: membrane protein insertase YidC [Bacteroidota bacterium]